MNQHQKINLRFAIPAGLILLLSFSRILPHPYNFSPLSAIGLFGAAFFSRKWQAFLIPLAATALSDIFINNVIYAGANPTFIWFYDGAYWQYISYILIIVSGLLIFRRKINLQRIITGALLASIIFFLISNFGTWYSTGLYPKTPAGLLECYTAGIPFIKGTLSGNLFYSGVLFGSFFLIRRKIPDLNFA